MEPTGLVWGLVIAAAILGCLLLLLGLYLRLRTGLPFGKVAYGDADGSGQVLYAARYGLAGKPDYLVRQGGHLIPVEAKPGRLASQPYRSDMLQLAAYGLLVKEEYGRWPPYGIVAYGSGSHKVPLTEELRRELLATLASMRLAGRAQDVPPSHRSPARCKACGLRDACDQRVEA